MARSTKKTSGSTHKIRIIGGLYKRTPIPVVMLDGLRPTPDRVRETVFNWLNHQWMGHFSDKEVLDPFAGTGAMGFEAASRGVAHVTLIEKNRLASQHIEQLKQKLELTQMDVIHGDASVLLKNTELPRKHLVILDPPFGQNWIGIILPLIEKLQYLGDLLYIESEQSFAEIPNYSLLRQDKAGAVFFHLFEKTVRPIS